MEVGGPRSETGVAVSMKGVEVEGGASVSMLLLAESENGEGRKDIAIHLPEFQLVWPLGSRVKGVSRYWGLTGKNGCRLRGWGLRQYPGRRKSGPTPRFGGVPQDWRWGGRTGLHKQSATELRMRLERQEWRTGKQVDTAYLTPSQVRLLASQVQSVASYNRWLTPRAGVSEEG